jgi:hypothetical protein
MKNILFTIAYTFLTFSLQAQNISNNKILPPGFEKEAVTALQFFPELNKTAIRFRIIETYTPLSTRPTFLSIFKKPAKRKYIITISNKTIKELSPILFHNLTDSARVGVLGHELSHVADFQKKNFWGFIRLAIKHSSKKYQDQFEFNTDKICLNHGMAAYLLSWSKFVRSVLHIKNWRGADNIKEMDAGIERYMNPETIEKYNREIPAGK